MSEDKILRWCRILQSQKDWPRDDAKIENVWNPVRKDLTVADQVTLLTRLVERDYVFKWLKLISHLLPDLSSKDYNFVALLEIVIDKIKGDMAQGDFIRSLINIGERYPEKGVELYSFIVDVSNDLTITYAGLLLGGAARQRFSEVFNIVERDLKKDRMSVKVACLKALRVAFETEGEVEFPSKILDILENMWEIEDPSLRTEIIQGYVDFRHYNPEVCEHKLLEIAEGGSSSERLTITNKLWFENLEDRAIEIQILYICSEDDNINVLTSVVTILSQKGQAFLEDGLEMVRKMLKKGLLHHIPNLEYAVKKLCENNLKGCQETFEKWGADPDLAFRFRVKTLKDRLDIFQE